MERKKLLYDVVVIGDYGAWRVGRDGTWVETSRGYLSIPDAVRDCIKRGTGAYEVYRQPGPIEIVPQ